MKIRRLLIAAGLVTASLAVAAPAAHAEPLCKYKVCEQVWLIACGLRPGGCI